MRKEKCRKHACGPRTGTMPDVERGCKCCHLIRIQHLREMAKCGCLRPFRKSTQKGRS
jgi:hypothetical protein